MLALGSQLLSPLLFVDNKIKLYLMPIMTLIEAIQNDITCGAIAPILSTKRHLRDRDINTHMLNERAQHVEESPQKGQTLW